MRKIITILSLLLTITAFTQHSGVVLDSYSKKPLPFVNILIDNGPKGTMTNIDGKYQIDSKFSKLHFTFIGYEDQLITFTNLKDTIYLSTTSNLLESIEIQPGINPAHRIIRLTSKKRKENRPEKNIHFTAESYHKFVLTGDMDSLLRAQEKDTANNDLLETLETQHLFLIESVSKKYHHKLKGSEEKVLASRTSGFQNPIFGALFTQFQTFSLYDNALEYGEKSFISPLAPGWKNRYLFMLQDSIKNEDSYTYVIRYQPKAKKNFDAFKGTLYINSKNYAIEKIAATTINPIDGAIFSILQNYQEVNNYWFPFELYIDITIENIISKNVLKGIGKSYIRDLNLNPNEKIRNSGFSFEVEDGASEKDETYWVEKRKDAITNKETKTYEVVDSIAKRHKFEKRLKLLQSILDGKLPLGPIDLNLMKIEGYNPFEGFTLGLDLHTSKRLSKTVQFGGFFRYGFKDRRFKYGGDITFNVYRKRNITLNIDFREDAIDRGGINRIENHSFIESSSGFNKYFARAKEYTRKIEAALGGYVRGNVQAYVFSNYQRRFFFDNYRYQTGKDFEASEDKYDLFEVGFKTRWTIKETVVKSEGDIISMGSKYPTIQLTYIQGLKGVINSKYAYSNIQLQVNQDFLLPGVGNLILQLNGAATFGTVPMSMLHFANGSNERVGFSVQNSFETMYSGEFLSDKQAALFLTMAFNELNTGSKWTAPQFSISSAVGIGSLSNQNYHSGYSFETMEKGYYESGLIINNILKLGYLGIGGGVFYKYGPYASIYEKNNFAYKIAVKFNL